MSWQDETAMLSPKEEREFWLAEVKKRMEWGGLLVNRRYMPSLDRTPQLQKLIDEGKLIRYRVKHFTIGRTFLMLANHCIECRLEEPEHKMSCSKRYEQTS